MKLKCHTKESNYYANGGQMNRRENVINLHALIPAYARLHICL